MNDKLCEEFELLRQEAVADDDRWRARHWTKVQKIVRDEMGPIHSVEDVRGRAEFGESTLEVVDQVCRAHGKGHAERVEQLVTNKPKMKRVEAIASFERIPGVGSKRATALYDRDGVRSLGELRARADALLTAGQRKSLVHLKDTEQRVTRSTAGAHLTFIKRCARAIDGARRPTLVGSFRRGAASSADVDVLVCDARFGQRDSPLTRLLVDQFKRADDGYVVEELSCGGQQWAGVARRGDGVGHRVDVHVCPTDEWYFQLLYFTGSNLFSEAMRSHAKNAHQLLLSQHGLFRRTSDGHAGASVLSNVKSEADIFSALGLAYRKPAERRTADDLEAVDGAPETASTRKRKRTKARD